METTKKASSKFELLSFGKLSLQTKNLPEKKVIWAGVKEGSFGYIYGPPKSGKTTFGENLALSLVIGRTTFWGKPLYDGKPHRVLFISFEENCIPRVDRIKKQIKNLTDDEKLLIAENYLQPGCEFQHSLATNQDWELLKEAIKQSNCKIVFIDSLTRLYTGAIEDSQTAQKVLLKLRKLSRDLDLTIICIHHITKGQTKGIFQDSAAGSRVVLQEADFGIGINRSTTGRRYLKEVFYRYEEDGGNMVQEFEINQDLWLNPLGTAIENDLFQRADNRKDDSNLEKVKQVISDIVKVDGTFLSSELNKRLVATKVMAKNTMYSHLSTLMESNYVSKKSEGVYLLVGYVKPITGED